MYQLMLVNAAFSNSRGISHWNFGNLHGEPEADRCTVREAVYTIFLQEGLV